MGHHSEDGSTVMGFVKSELHAWFTTVSVVICVENKRHVSLSPVELLNCDTIVYWYLHTVVLTGSLGSDRRSAQKTVAS